MNLIHDFKRRICHHWTPILYHQRPLHELQESFRIHFGGYTAHHVPAVLHPLKVILPLLLAVVLCEYVDDPDYVALLRLYTLRGKVQVAIARSLA